MFCCVFKYFFVLLNWILAAAPRCGMWDLVPGPGIEPGHPELEVPRLSHWITRKDPLCVLVELFSLLILLQIAVGII